MFSLNNNQHVDSFFKLSNPFDVDSDISPWFPLEKFPDLLLQPNYFLLLFPNNSADPFIFQITERLWWHMNFIPRDNPSDLKNHFSDLSVAMLAHLSFHEKLWHNLFKILMLAHDVLQVLSVLCRVINCCLIFCPILLRLALKFFRCTGELKTIVNVLPQHTKVVICPCS